MPIHWLQPAAGREIIRRWTMPADGHDYALALPQPPDPERFELLALGDTGDSEAAGPHLSPQEAVARFLARDAAPPVGVGRAVLVLHLGDVVYMTGERRLYDRNFRRPYAPFLEPESTVENLVFRLPFLPVPGNHDYYDLAPGVLWMARAVARSRWLGAGLRALARELFAFSIPQGGSERGAAYMEAFVDAAARSEGPLPYLPGRRTRLPNRYYRCRVGSVDLIALDSNTLQAPPAAGDRDALRAAARRRARAAAEVRELDARVATLHRELRRHELALERWQTRRRKELLADPRQRAQLERRAAAVEAALEETCAVLARVRQAEGAGAPECAEAERAVGAAREAWSAALGRAGSGRLGGLPEGAGPAAERVAAALGALEGCLAGLPEGESRRALLAARAALETAHAAWRELFDGTPPAELERRLRELSEAALDVQRDLALERSRRRYRPEDHDACQLEWLRRTLDRLDRERPDGWRIVYLHHPLYSTIRNHCEHADIREVRENLLPLLAGRVHLVLSGHSHAFEWIRSDRMPETALVVTGGGGQPALRRSILHPVYFSRYRDRLLSLCRAGATECAIGGRGPAAADGEDGFLYHYLRIEVTPSALRVRPIGVRRLASGAFRREAPMPVYHVPRLAPGPEHPGWEPRRLEAIEVRRGQPPRAVWAE